MASTASSVLDSHPAPLSAVPVCPAPVRPVRGTGRAPRPVAPPAARRDGVVPGARRVRLVDVAAVGAVRAACPAAAEPAAVDAPAAQSGGDRYAPAPLRLTERGRRVVASMSVAIGLCIAAGTVVTIEYGSADGGLQLAGASTVVVESGDTLWSIARSVAPDEDPRAVVDAIVELNGLDSVDLLPGAELQLP